MSSTTTQDGARPLVIDSEPDAHGQAALLLSESTIHMLVARKLLTVADAITVVETAAEVKVEVAEAEGESKRRMCESLELLDRIASTFAVDGDGNGNRDGNGNGNGNGNGHLRTV